MGYSKTSITIFSHTHFPTPIIPHAEGKKYQ